MTTQGYATPKPHETLDLSKDVMTRDGQKVVGLTVDIFRDEVCGVQPIIAGYTTTNARPPIYRRRWSAQGKYINSNTNMKTEVEHPLDLVYKINPPPENKNPAPWSPGLHLEEAIEGREFIELTVPNNRPVIVEKKSIIAILGRGTASESVVFLSGGETLHVDERYDDIANMLKK